MNVPMLDLKPQYTDVREEILAAVADVIDNTAFCNGPAVRDLEAALAEYSGCAEGIGVSSGTDALLVSMMALGIGAGDEVITTPFTFFATAGCIARTGARPVFVDIEPDTFNIAPAKIEAAITERTKAIVPVHLYGQMADMDAIMAIAARHALAVIEDSAQSVGSAYKGRKACSMGTVGCLSFYPTKNLGAMGDAGMVLTNDDELAERIRMFRNHGQGSTYVHEAVGGNFRMDTICAAGLLVQLKRLGAWSASRRANAAQYDQLLADCPGVTTPPIREGNESIYNQYVIRAERRDALRAHLVEQGIGCGIYYPLCLHEQQCFADLGYAHGDFPESERAATEVLALPIFAELGEERLAVVADAIKAFYA